MKKIALSLLCVGVLTISANSKECGLIITPSDFQLDNQLRAPNESYAFSAIGNLFYISNIRGFTKSILCGGLSPNDVDKTRSCIAELNHMIEIDSDKLDGSSLTDVVTHNLSDGFKMSGKSPISKKHLCEIQNKYKTTASYSRAILLPLLEARQEKNRKNYLEASETTGQTTDTNEITDIIMRIENRE